MKQNASLDASFWINACAANIVEFAPSYFQLYASTTVAEEIRYPLTVLGIESLSAILFNQWVETGVITLQDAQINIDWFQRGENAALALAIQYGYWLLMDDANPYHRARSAGLKVVGTSELVVLLFDHNYLAHDVAVAAIKQTNASQRLKRDSLVMLEFLARRKGA